METVTRPGIYCFTEVGSYLGWKDVPHSIQLDDKPVQTAAMTRPQSKGQPTTVDLYHVVEGRFHFFANHALDGHEAKFVAAAKDNWSKRKQAA